MRHYSRRPRETTRLTAPNPVFEFQTEPLTRRELAGADATSVVIMYPHSALPEVASMALEIDLLTVDGEQDPRVIRAAVSGQLLEADYRLLSPRIDELLDKHSSVRLLVQLSDFEGWSAGGAWEDAKLGIHAFSSIERLAIIGEKRWEEWMTLLARPFTLADVRFFEPFDAEKALSWITEPSQAHIRISVEEDRRVVRVRPSGSLTKADFLALADEVDPLIEKWGAVNGLVIESRDLPGWESLGALIHHLRFVSDHHRKIRRVALVTESSLGSVAEHVAGHFVAAKIKQFDPADLDIALSWAGKGDE